ncbi:hypothetical protein PMAYCL1PPCAC_01575, partial [Pristionchus mayeri]
TIFAISVSRPMFRDSRIDLSTKPVIEQMRQMTLCRHNRSPPSIDPQRGDDSMKYFPLLGLPNELITHSLSFLPMRDRLRARVNKRLDQIELESKYSVENLHIEEASPNSEHRRNYSPSDSYISFVEGRSNSADCLRRVAQNASVNYLKINVGSEPFHREVYYSCVKFNATTLDLRFKNDQLENEIIEDSFFLDLARKFENLMIDRCLNISANALHQVAKGMIDGSMKVRKLTTQIDHIQCLEFLDLINIYYNSGFFYSTRDIEVYSFSLPANGLPIHFIIFDGSLEIHLTRFGLGRIVSFTLTFHNTLKSLDDSKKRKVAIGYDIHAH